MQCFRSKWYNRIASLPTILISAVFHEYVLWAPVRFVLPLLLFMFGFFGSKFTWKVCALRVYNYTVVKKLAHQNM